jgi:hypothetical protein
MGGLPQHGSTAEGKEEGRVSVQVDLASKPFQEGKKTSLKSKSERRLIIFSLHGQISTMCEKHLNQVIFNFFGLFTAKQSLMSLLPSVNHLFYQVIEGALTLGILRIYISLMRLLIQ